MLSEDEALFARGAALFNNGEYFACHEVWEELWKRSAGERRAGIQGLIQVAAALLHAERGNRLGALSLYGKAIRNLEVARHDRIESGLGCFRKSLEEYFKTVEKGMIIPFSARLACELKSLGLKG